MQLICLTRHLTKAITHLTEPPPWRGPRKLPLPLKLGTVVDLQNQNAHSAQELKVHLKARLCPYHKQTDPKRRQLA